MRHDYYLGDRPRLGIRITETDAVTIASATANYAIFNTANATIATGVCAVVVSGPVATASFYPDLGTAFAAGLTYHFQIELVATVGTQGTIRTYEDRFKVLA